MQQKILTRLLALLMSVLMMTTVSGQEQNDPNETDETDDEQVSAATATASENLSRIQNLTFAYVADQTTAISNLATNPSRYDAASMPRSAAGDAAGFVLDVAGLNLTLPDEVAKIVGNPRGIVGTCAGGLGVYYERNCFSRHWRGF